MRARVEKVDVLGWNKSIVLLDFEENHTYKRTGKEAMRASIYHEQVDTEQYIRPHRSAADHGINCRLVFD